MKEYRAIRRNLGYHLKEALSDVEEPIRPSAISRKLRNEVGIWINRRTLEGLLHIYRGHLGAAPLKVVGRPSRGYSARYRLNDEFYRRFEVRPSNEHGEGLCYRA